MRKGIEIEVSAADRARLEAIVADRNSPQKHVWRARIILASGAGCGTNAGSSSRVDKDNRAGDPERTRQVILGLRPGHDAPGRCPRTGATSPEQRSMGRSR